MPLFQHQTDEFQCVLRGTLSMKDSGVNNVPELPDAYTNVHPAVFKCKNPLLPRPITPLHIDTGISLAHEFEWLKSVRLTQTADANVNITWAAHHISKNRGKAFEVSISSLLSLLRESAQSVSTVKQVMGKIKDTVAYLYPGQIPVITADQPIFALAKQIQWTWPDQYGEDKVVIMLEDCILKWLHLSRLETYYSPAVGQELLLRQT